MPTSDARKLIQTTLVGEALDAAPVAIFVADDDRRYIAVNEYACLLLGYTRNELLALGVLDVAVTPGGPPGIRARTKWTMSSLNS